MESRKKFRSDISNGSIKALMQKKVRKFSRPQKDTLKALADKALVANQQQPDDGHLTYIKYIPTSMLASQDKLRRNDSARRVAERPQEEVRPSDKQRYAAERDNITEKTKGKQSWSLANLNLMIIHNRKRKAEESCIKPIRKPLPDDL